MLPFYNLRKKLGLADLQGRRAARQPSPLELAILATRTGQTGGDVLEEARAHALATAIAERYREASRSFAGHGDSMWDGINRLARPVHMALLEGSPAEIADALDHPHRTNLFLGFDNPVAAPWGFEADDRNLLSNEVGPDMARRIYLAVRRLAEATGAVHVANPETGTGTALAVDEYLDLIETQIGAALTFPNFYPHEKGLRSRRGVVSYRPLQAIYQAWRLKTLGADKVMEIGAGLGRTAYYAHQFGIREYTIVDIPLSNVAQAHFLSRALGEDTVSLGNEARPVRVTDTRFVDVTRERFDIVLNVDSLSEIDAAAAANYVAFARRQASAFLSINREWEDRPRSAELLRGFPVSRYPYWMRDGYVEELVTFTT